ncbi:unnamed protein product, partial [Rotaria magnacalcarata]
MTSNNSSGKWSVRIVPLPTSINYIRLAHELRLPQSRVFIPKLFNSNISYAWIKDFSNEDDANEFVRQWSGASIQGQIIECIASLSRNDQANREPNQQREFRPSTEPKTQREDFDLPSTRSLLMST